MLSYAPASVVEGAVAELSSAARKAILRRMESVRQTGRERIASTVVSGIVNLSAPVFDHRGQVVAALTVPYLGQRYARTSVDAAEEALLATGKKLSAALGAASLPRITGRSA